MAANSPMLNLHTLPTGPWAVALSGGPDSMALLHSLAATAVTDIHALIVDHRLRPESGREAQQVSDAVKTWPRVVPHILVWSHGEVTSRLMEEARVARYSLLTGWCRDHAISNLFVAHHADDQMETFLFRLAKGSGLDGLAGMRSVTESDGVNILRPLLSATKQQILDYCRAHRLPYVTDPSNADSAYARPRLRKSRAALEAEGLTATRIGKTADRIARARTALDWMTQHATEESLKSDGYDWAALSRYPEEIILRVVLNAMRALRADEPYDPRLEKLENLIAALVASPAEFRGQTLGGCLIQLKRGQLCITPEKQRPPLFP